MDYNSDLDLSDSSTVELVQDFGAEPVVVLIHGVSFDGNNYRELCILDFQHIRLRIAWEPAPLCINDEALVHQVNQYISNTTGNIIWKWCKGHIPQHAGILGVEVGAIPGYVFVKLFLVVIYWHFTKDLLIDMASAMDMEIFYLQWLYLNCYIYYIIFIKMYFIMQIKDLTSMILLSNVFILPLKNFHFILSDRIIIIMFTQSKG